jgi:hypothetical protein
MAPNLIMQRHDRSRNQLQLHHEADQPRRTRGVGQQPLRGGSYLGTAVGEYNATTGAAINANFTTGLNASGELPPLE